MSPLSPSKRTFFWLAPLYLTYLSLNLVFNLVIVSILFASSAAFAANGLPGDAEREQVRAAISAHSNEVRVCYRDNEKSLKGASGKIYFEFEVNDTGYLIRAEKIAKKSTFSNKQLENCLHEKFKTWMFPASPKGSTLVVVYPFSFKKSQ